MKKLFNNNDITNLRKKSINKCIKVKDTYINFEIKSAIHNMIGEHDILLDEILIEERIDKVLNALVTTTSRYNPLPKKVVIYNEENENYTIKDDLKNELANIYKPRFSFEDIYLGNNIRDNIITALTVEKNKEILFEKWKIKGNIQGGQAVCLNFWGPPGTGKSITAEAIAKYLNKDILKVNYSELESKFVGETPKNIKKIFAMAKEYNAVIVFDEADSFLGKRLQQVSQSADYGINISRSVMLIELDNYDGIVIFTTNLMRNYDDAFKRRILTNIEFRLPNEKGRQQILKLHLPDTIPLSKDIKVENLAKQIQNVSGSDIKDIILFAAAKCLKENRNVVDNNDFQYSYNMILNRYKNENITISTNVITEN